jgi:hypothetical protein
MKKRRMLGIEALEARETPDVSLSSAVAYPAVPQSANQAVIGGAGAATQPQPGATPHAVGPEVLDKDVLLGWLDSSSKPYLSPQALKTLFSNAEELEKLLATPGRLPQGEEATQALAPVAATQQSQDQGWQYLFNYSRKAIRNAELKFGTLPDHEDMVHQIFVEWREQVGPADQTFARLLNQDSTERQILRKTVRRVIDHTRYEQSRQRRMVELIDQPAPAKPGEQDWIDLRLDWSMGPAITGPRQQRMLVLRSQGMTFEEIGLEMGLPKQRVCEAINDAVQRLQELYGPV